MILIIADKNDEDAKIVKKIIQKKYGIACIILSLNLNNLNFYINIDKNNEDIKIEYSNKAFYLKEFQAVWFRSGFFPDEILIKRLPKVSKKFLTYLNGHYINEAKHFINYLFHFLIREVPIILGDPFFENQNKLISLYNAKKVKFEILNTIILNNKIHYEKNLLRNKTEYVNKNIHSNFTFRDKNNFYYTPTNYIDKESLFKKLNNTFFPSIFQNFIPTFKEVKIVYINGLTFCCILKKEKVINHENIVDFKDNFNEFDKKNYERITVKESLKNKIESFMKLQNLNFGILDFLIDSKGKEYFLEVNPHGQYSFISWGCGYNINLKIAEFLCQKS